MSTKPSSDQLAKAEELINFAQIFGTSIFDVLMSKYPPLEKIGKQYGEWIYLVSIACVGSAFMSMCNDLPENDQRAMPYAIQDELVKWREKSYDHLCDFLQYHDDYTETSDNKAPEAIGSWIIKCLSTSPDSDLSVNKLDEFTSIYEPIGMLIIKEFLFYWRK